MLKRAFKAVDYYVRLPSRFFNGRDPSFPRYMELTPAVQAHISGYLNQSELARLNQALGHVYFDLRKSSQIANTFWRLHFQTWPGAGKLLTAVIRADYEEAANLKPDDNHLVFQPVPYRYPNGRVDCVSPLKFALRGFDTYMWEIFYLRIKVSPKYIRQFFQQALEGVSNEGRQALAAAFRELDEREALCSQDRKNTRNRINRDQSISLLAETVARHFPTHQPNLEMLIAVQEEFIEARRQWTAHPAENKESYHGAWQRMGRTQKEVLPFYMHVMKEYGRGQQRCWRNPSHYDVERRPPPPNFQVYYHHDATWRSPWQTLDDPHLGVKYNLEPGGVAQWCVTEGPAYIHPYPEEYRCLLKVRIKDLAMRLFYMWRKQNDLLELPEEKQEYQSRASIQARP